MLLAAQRVQSPSGREGINTFRYGHHSRAWPSNPLVLLDSDPGTLERQDIEVVPPGNDVRSYLDLLAPDGFSEQQLRRVLAQLYFHFTPESFPARHRIGECAVRFGLSKSLAEKWQAELYVLGERALSLLRQEGPARP